MEKTNHELMHDRKDRYEIICGVVIAFLAAILAISNLISDRFSGNMMIAENEKASAYSWYTSKSIKQTLVEGQYAIIESLLAAGSVLPEQEESLRSILSDFQAKIEKYNNEKTEILEGSDVVGEENWAQDVDGEMGKIVGAQEWEQTVNRLNHVGDFFDLSALFLEIGLVLGAISLVIDQFFVKKIFFAGMSILGLAGFIIAMAGVYQGFQA
ncbi:MAG: DUF4337 domain-containing protein [bacterium]|nr:DUF4337 domain-containing protein [bacterium]